MTVYLVGAGPGDPGLLTRRGAELLAIADVVIYDRLSAPSLLDLAPAGAERINVGKRSPGGATQDEIHELLVRHGRTGKTVVRLKGGDPFVFARGAEEMAVLYEAGIAVEVVPGITSAIAAPAYAGIPVTRRYSSTSFTVVTGHEDPNKGRVDVDWESIAKVGGTIVILMGVANIATIAERLQAGGLPAETPAAAVRWGTRPEQHTIRATLGTIAAQPLAAPSVIVVGEVAGDELAWYTHRPLFGRTVVVTRAPHQASRLADRLSDRGASVLNVPTIDIVDAADGGAGLRTALDRVGDYEWLVVTSPNGAERTLAALGDARRLAGVKLAAIGPGTAAALTRSLLVPDLLPERYVAEGLLEAFPDPPHPGAKVLLCTAEETRGVLDEGLTARGWQVDVAVAYRTVPAAVPERVLASIGGADVVAFASSSAVNGFAAAVPRHSWPAVAAAIGPITADTARQAGFDRVVEAERHDIDGLVEAIVGWSAEAPRS